MSKWVNLVILFKFINKLSRSIFFFKFKKSITLTYSRELPNWLIFKSEIKLKKRNFEEKFDIWNKSQEIKSNVKVIKYYFIIFLQIVFVLDFYWFSFWFIIEIIFSLTTNYFSHKLFVKHFEKLVCNFRIFFY